MIAHTGTPDLVLQFVCVPWTHRVAIVNCKCQIFNTAYDGLMNSACPRLHGLAVLLKLLLRATQATPCDRQRPSEDPHMGWSMDSDTQRSPRVMSQTADPDDPDVSVLQCMVMLFSLGKFQQQAMPSIQHSCLSKLNINMSRLRTAC